MCSVVLAGELRGRGGECLVEVLDDVIDVLDADAQAHEVRADAGRGLLLSRHLAMRGRSRMGHQRAHVADVHETLEDLERVVELDAGLKASLGAEAEQARGLAASVLLCQLVVGRVG